MDSIHVILQKVQDWASQWLTPDLLPQVLVVLAAIGIARLLHLRYSAWLDQKLGDREKKGLTRAAMRGSLRVAFPFTMLFLVLAGRGMLAQLSRPIVLLDILVPLLLSLAAIRLIVYLLRRSSGTSPALRAWEGMISTTIWSIVALHLLGWLPDILAALDGIAITAGETRISLLSVGKTILAIALFILLANWLSRTIENSLKNSPYVSSSMKVGVSKVSRFVLFSLAILTGLYSVGIDLTALTVFGGALGVALGFGLQRIASNFISGFILLFDRSIRPGDVISIGERFGWVQELHARYIVVRDRDGVETLIPNENLITSEVTNWSYSDRHIRLKIPIQVSYGDDPEHCLELLAEASRANPRILSNPAPQARLMGFGDNGIDLELRVWLADPEQGVANVRSDVNLAIWRLFKEHDVSIPFPQRDVYIKSDSAPKRPDLP